MRYFDIMKQAEASGLSVFGLGDLAKITGKPTSYLKVYAHKLSRQGKLLHLARDKYALRSIDKFGLQQLHAADTYVSLNSALEYYGCTTQMYSLVQLVGAKQHAKLHVEDLQVTTSTIAAKRFFGYARVRIAGVSVMMAEPEKMLIDCAYFSQEVRSGDLLAAIEYLKGTINVEKLIRYLQRFSSIVTNKRLGFLLARAGIDIHAHVTTNEKYERLNVLGRAGERDQKWHLIINEGLDHDT